MQCEKVKIDTQFRKQRAALTGVIAAFFPSLCSSLIAALTTFWEQLLRFHVMSSHRLPCLRGCASNRNIPQSWFRVCQWHLRKPATLLLKMPQFHCGFCMRHLSTGAQAFATTWPLCLDGSAYCVGHDFLWETIAHASQKLRDSPPSRPGHLLVQEGAGPAKPAASSCSQRLRLVLLEARTSSAWIFGS